MKLLHFIIAALLLASCLTGCGQDANAAKYAQTFEALLTSQRAGGVTLAGGKVQFVTPGAAPGTMEAPTNLKAIYADRNKTTPAANPYTLSADGTAQVFGDGLYDVYVYNSAGVLKYTWEDVRIQEVSILNADSLLSDYASLSAAVTAIGSTPASLTIDQDTTVSADTTIPATLELKFTAGSIITVSSGKTLTINGTMNADLSQKFAGSGTVTIGDLIPEAFPQWWGADASGTADSAAAIQSAVSSGCDVVNGAFGLFKSIAKVSVPSNTTIKNISVYDPNYRTSNHHNFFEAIGTALANLENISFDNVTILGNNTSYAVQGDTWVYNVHGYIDGIGIYLKYVSGGSTRNVNCNYMVSGMVVHLCTNYYVDTFKTLQAEGDSFTGLTLAGSTNSHARNCYIRNGGDGALFIYNGAHCSIRDSEVVNSLPATYNQAGSGMESCIQCLIDNVKVTDAAVAFYMVEWVNSGTISNSTADGCNNGFVIGHFGTGLTGHDLNLTNNKIINMTDRSIAYPVAGFYLFSTATKAISTSIKIIGNYFGHSNVGKGILVDCNAANPLKGLVVSGNTFEAYTLMSIDYDPPYGTGQPYETTEAIIHCTYVSEAVFSGNFIITNFTPSLDYQIVFSNSNKVAFTGNIIRRDQEHHIMTADAGCDFFTVTGNIWDEPAAGGYRNLYYLGTNLVSDGNLHEYQQGVSANGGLPTFTNNSSALAAALVPGQRYRTAVGAVMTVFTP